MFFNDRFMFRNALGKSAVQRLSDMAVHPAGVAGSAGGARDAEG